MKIKPKISATNGKISGSKLNKLGYRHLNKSYDYSIEAVPNLELKYLRTYHYPNTPDRYDLTIVDKNLLYLSGPLICMGPDITIYTQWVEELIMKALAKTEAEMTSNGAIDDRYLIDEDYGYGEF